MKGDSTTVLMIEDDLSYVRFIQEILKESSRARFELIHVNRLNEAMTLLDKEVCDVVLLDLNLPDSWGFDTFQRVHSQFPSIPVVVLTGLEDEELGMKAAQKGGYYLSKGDAAGRLLLNTIQHAIERTRLMDDLEKSYQKFYQLSAHLQHLREEERKLIARELHDELGGLLTAIKTELIVRVNSLADRHRDLSEMERSLSELIDKGIDTVHRISTDLRPSILDHLGLIPAIEWHIQEFQKRTGIQCQWVLCDGEIPLDKDHALAVFRIAQEALTNVARHSKASRVTVDVSKSDGAMTFKIEDNGVGFNEKKVHDPQSFGLLGIQERTLFLKGQVAITSIPQEGTTVAVTIPIP